jgi:two-component system chemotaxis response regulator CheB
MFSNDCPRIRTLIVDDSATARRLVSQAVAAEPDMEVVGLAECGRAALERVGRDQPDVVVLDLEMPGMDGFELLKELKRRNPRLPVLIFSSHTHRGADATVDALLAGADDYALKPSGSGNGSSDSWAATQQELTSKLRAMAGRARRLSQHQVSQQPSLALTGQPAPLPPTAPALVASARIDAIAIGTSIGGPEALAVILPRLPRHLSVPLLIVQHMPTGFTQALAKRLDEKSALAVVEARHGQRVSAGVAYLAPGDFHLQLSRRHEHVSLMLDRGPLENGCRPSVDPLFRSAAAVYGASLLAVVLTGMGSDGLLGAQRVVELGGHVWVQDQQSSMVWGMAGAVARAGIAQRVVPLTALASTLETVIAHGLPAQVAEPRRGDT